MSKELINLGITLNEDGFITSVDLVEIINYFREEEFNILKDKGLNKKNNVTLLTHGDFIKKIKKELEVLKSLGLIGQGNISKSSYINSQNKEQPCFKLNRDGMLQMLNSESTIVRYKTVEYINELEEQLNNAKETIDTVDEIVTKTGSLEEVEWKKIKKKSKFLTKEIHDKKTTYNQLINTMDNPVELQNKINEIINIVKPMKNVSVKKEIINSAVKTLNTILDDIGYENNPISNCIREICHEGIQKLQSIRILQLEKKIYNDDYKKCKTALNLFFSEKNI